MFKNILKNKTLLAVLVVSVLYILMNYNAFFTKGVSSATEIALDVTARVGDAAETAVETTGAVAGNLTKGVKDTSLKVVETVGESSEALVGGSLKQAGKRIVTGAFQSADQLIDAGVTAGISGYKGLGEVYSDLTA